MSHLISCWRLSIWIWTAGAEGRLELIITQGSLAHGLFLHSTWQPSEYEVYLAPSRLCVDTPPSPSHLFSSFHISPTQVACHAVASLPPFLSPPSVDLPLLVLMIHACHLCPWKPGLVIIFQVLSANPLLYLISWLKVLAVSFHGLLRREGPGITMWEVLSRSRA